VTEVEWEAKVRALETALGRASHERDEYRKLYELVSLELDRVKRHLFGKKAEHVDAAQMQLAFASIAKMLSALPDADPTKDQSEPAAKKPPKKARPHGRHPLPDHLPIERVELLPPEVQAEGADAYVRIGEEITETLEWRAGSYVRFQIVRPKFAKKAQPEAGILTADLPPRAIEKGLAGPGLLAQVLVRKYADGLPLNRQESIFARDGIDLARSTMCEWVQTCGDLFGCVVDAMAVDSKRTAPYIAVDATGVLVQAPEQCRRGHFWVLIAPGSHVLFRFTPRHTRDGPKAFFRDYRGYVVADAATVYDELYRTEQVLEVGCWAHARRHFFDAMVSDKDRALEAIGFIGRIFEADRSTVELPPSSRGTARRDKAEPVLAAFRGWLDARRLEVLPKSPIAQAIGYVDNQWMALTRFLVDGRLPVHNNHSERELRRIAVGRKAWLFVGHDDAAEAAANIISLIASCKLHRLEPWAYLRDLLTVLPGWDQTRVLQLAPKYWVQHREQIEAAKAALPVPSFHR
jgi:transposase